MIGHRPVARSRRRRLSAGRPAFALLLAASIGAVFAVAAAEPPSRPAAAGAKAAAYAFGTYQRPFAADSFWNSRPVDPVLGDFEIPKSDYFPSVGEGAWSTGVFLAKPGDRSMNVKGKDHPGVWDPDAEQEREVVIPRWPDDLEPAAEADGHADIVDPVMGVVHSFWQLKKVDGRWTAAQYAWSPLAGRGWGDPAHYFQGARAAGVATSGGLMRKHEIGDGDSVYRHALAVSLTFNALSAQPTYVFPSTSADNTAATTNSGRIPEGALLMLPPSFDAARLRTPELRKVAETLKVYGARVVDRNYGTPFNIYVEIGSGFSLHRSGWNNTAAEDLDTMRAALREVRSTSGWLDGNGKAFTPTRNLNRLSMRGPWRLESGAAGGAYDTWQQAVVFPRAEARVVQVNDTGRNLNGVTWALPEPGQRFRLTAAAEGGAKLRLVLRDKIDGRPLFDSGELANGETRLFPWPANSAPLVYAISGLQAASKVGGTLLAVDAGGAAVDHVAARAKR